MTIKRFKRLGYFWPQFHLGQQEWKKQSALSITSFWNLRSQSNWCCCRPTCTTKCGSQCYDSPVPSIALADTWRRGRQMSPNVLVLQGQSRSCWHNHWHFSGCQCKNTPMNQNARKRDSKVERYQEENGFSSYYFLKHSQKGQQARSSSSFMICRPNKSIVSHPVN